MVLCRVLREYNCRLLNHKVVGNKMFPNQYKDIKVVLY